MQHPNRAITMKTMLVLIGCIWLITAGCRQSTGVSPLISNPVSTPATNTTLSATVSEVKYVYFEEKSDDIWFSAPEGYLKPQLFSFEYPDVIGYSDPRPNEGFVEYHQDVISYDFRSRSNGNNYPMCLYIIIQKPGYLDTYTPQDVIAYFKEKDIGVQNPKEKTITVAGIQANYLEYYSYISDDIFYRDHYLARKMAVFEFRGDIWNIRLFWPYYSQTEPPEIEKYFNHAVETFRFLE
jgi:hypothetical protein